ncbi:MAG: hypothetical protein ACXVP2_09925 [Tumebacillaceae bacterium]
MNVLDQLSSQTGDRTEESNLRVVEQCLQQPDLLDFIGEGLGSQNAALVGDAAEVLTKVAEQQPELVVPYMETLSSLLDHKTTRVRWESMHALALTAYLQVELIRSLLPQLASILREDKSTIVRDYAIDCLANLTVGDAKTVEHTKPLLIEALSAWEGKHAARVLRAMTQVAKTTPKDSFDLLAIGHQYADHPISSVQKAAKQLIKAAQ